MSLASLPPLVNTTSSVPQPCSPATCPRARSRAALTVAPAQCGLEGFAKGMLEGTAHHFGQMRVHLSADVVIEVDLAQGRMCVVPPLPMRFCASGAV